jgi:hypothetical protein
VGIEFLFMSDFPKTRPSFILHERIVQPHSVHHASGERSSTYNVLTLSNTALSLLAVLFKEIMTSDDQIVEGFTSRHSRVTGGTPRLRRQANANTGLWLPESVRKPRRSRQTRSKAYYCKGAVRDTEPVGLKKLFAWQFCEHGLL